MNIFYLDHNTSVCSRYHCDKHVVKMILEYAQLLSTTHHILDKDSAPSVLYKPTHINHPSAVWARANAENYRWLVSLFIDLNKEYTFRYNKRHKSKSLLSSFLNVPRNIPDGSFYQPTQAMPPEFKIEGDSITAYRNYYRGAKRDIAHWTKRDLPFFMSEVL